MKSTPDRAKAMMGHILAMNKNPSVGKKNNNQPPRGTKGGKVQAFAKGGAVKANPFGKHADAKQDKKMIKKMVDKKCIKKAKGGK